MFETRIKEKLKTIPFVRTVWNRSPAFIRNWLGSKAPDLSTDERPPMYRLAGHTHQIRLRPGSHEDLSTFTAALVQARVILHIGEGVESIHHVDGWLPYMSAVDHHIVVVFRSRQLFERVARERANVNIIYIRNARQSEWLVNHMPHLTAVFYDANTGNKAHFIRFFHLQHIFLGHGDSEKSASCGKHFRSFDEVWTAGQAHIDRFANTGVDFSSLRFRIIGRPHVRPLLEKQQQSNKLQFLYLPTWEGYHEDQNYSSIYLLGHFLKPVCRLTKQTAIVKLHPSTGKRDHALRHVEKNLHREQNDISNNDPKLIVANRAKSSVNLMIDAAFLVADISSVVSDFLVTNRPIFLYVPENKIIRTSSSAKPLNSYCYVFANKDQLLALVQRVIVEGCDHLQEARLRIRDYFINTAATRNHAFEKNLRQLANGQADPNHVIRLLT